MSASAGSGWAGATESVASSSQAPVENEKPFATWPANFFTEIIGGWEGAPLVREPQGSYETRSELK